MGGRIVDLLSTPHLATEALLPWLLNDTLTSAERSQVEAHLMSKHGQGAGAGTIALRRACQENPPEQVEVLLSAFTCGDAVNASASACSRVKKTPSQRSPNLSVTPRVASIAARALTIRSLFIFPASALRVEFPCFATPAIPARPVLTLEQLGVGNGAVALDAGEELGWLA